jgi:hypothetical protein
VASVAGYNDIRLSTPRSFSLELIKNTCYSIPYPTLPPPTASSSFVPTMVISLPSLPSSLPSINFFSRSFPTTFYGRVTRRQFTLLLLLTSLRRSKSKSESKSKPKSTTTTKAQDRHEHQQQHEDNSRVPSSRPRPSPSTSSLKSTLPTKVQSPRLLSLPLSSNPTKTAPSQHHFSNHGLHGLGSLPAQLTPTFSTPEVSFHYTLVWMTTTLWLLQLTRKQTRWKIC